ncbi:MAG TPA: hypothetical protein PK033_13040 [Acetivibrio sp.]|jgi:hypothetical protein|nr:hypothetical protein [Acetivibrio sp.]HPU62961.1 hypothetical protein [Mobilitalea sp.]HQA58786.1 hypothetical protein [Acetivibrio sp.]
MSKQADQRYRKEAGLNHKERAKDSNMDNTVKDMPSREGYGDGDPHGFSDNNDDNTDDND